MRLRTSRKREVGLVLFVIAIFGILALTLWPTYIWEDSPGLWGDFRILIERPTWKSNLSLVPFTVFKDYANGQEVLDEAPADCNLMGTWPIRDGLYVIGAPDTNNYCGEGASASENDIRGVYNDMTAFAEAYNATDSALKAEIDTWDTTYWQVTDGAISFVDKSAA